MRKGRGRAEWGFDEFRFWVCCWDQRKCLGEKGYNGVPTAVKSTLLEYLQRALLTIQTTLFALFPRPGNTNHGGERRNPGSCERALQKKNSSLAEPLSGGAVF